MSSFKFQARYVLLTYAQCGDLDPWVVSNHLSSLGAECIIGREDHSDGGIHLHAFVDFGRRFSTRDVTKFDVGGRHPNIEPSKGRPWAGYDYAIKDGDVVAGGLERPAESGGSKLPANAERWAQIVAAETRDEFWRLLAELDPGAMVRSFTQCRAYAEHRYRTVREAYSTPPGIVVEGERLAELGQWVESNLGGYSGGDTPPLRYGLPRSSSYRPIY
uniref:Replication-associated protein n=1 Tax=Emberiza spodocephala Genomoviridae sp. TaxID=2814950 RepID=A0A8A4XCC3_9VIRU